MGQLGGGATAAERERERGERVCVAGALLKKNTVRQFHDQMTSSENSLRYTFLQHVFQGT